MNKLIHELFFVSSNGFSLPSSIHSLTDDDDDDEANLIIIHICMCVCVFIVTFISHARTAITFFYDDAGVGGEANYLIEKKSNKTSNLLSVNFNDPLACERNHCWAVKFKFLLTIARQFLRSSCEFIFMSTF